MRSIPILTLVALLVLVPVAVGQNYVLGTQAQQNTDTTWPTPYGNWYSGQRAQYLYQASELIAAGMTAGNLQYIGWSVITASLPDTTPLAGTDGHLDAYEIKLGLTTTMDLSAGWETPNVVPLVTVFGPSNTWADVAGWNYHSFPSPFPWDGTSNILVEICHWNGVSNYGRNAIVYSSPTTHTSALTEYDDQNPPCGSGMTIDVQDNIRPDTAFGYGVPPASPYQVNGPGASLDFDGIQGSSLMPAGAVRAIGQFVTLNGNSTNMGLPYDIVVGFPDLLVPLGGGGFATPGGQVVNINLTSPGLFYVYGGTLTSTFPGAFSVPMLTTAPLTASAQMFVIDPSLIDGVALSAGNDLTVLNCSFSEDFETGVVGIPGTYPAGWVDGGGTMMWNVHSGTTSSSATGPTGDHTTGSGNYMYCETSSSTAGDTFILNVPPVNATATQLNANFWVHMYGATMGTVNLEEFDGTNWNVRWTMTGDQGNIWLNQNVPLLTPTGGQYVLRVHYTAGTSFTGDASIDDFRVCQ